LRRSLGDGAQQVQELFPAVSIADSDPWLGRNWSLFRFVVLFNSFRDGVESRLQVHLNKGVFIDICPERLYGRDFGLLDSLKALEFPPLLIMEFLLLDDLLPFPLEEVSSNGGEKRGGAIENSSDAVHVGV
jgi:hypothetical protein